MDSHSPTLSPGTDADTSNHASTYTSDTITPDSPEYAPKPPPHLFRVIKRLSTNTFLCLPRHINHTPAPVPTALPSLSAFANLPSENQRMHQQSWNIEHPWSDVLVWMMQHNGASGLSAKNVDLMPQVVVVTTGSKVRKKVEVLEALNEYESASLHVPRLLKAQMTKALESSWCVTAPVFGPSLKEFGEKQTEGGGMASWMVAHVFLALLDSIGYVHTAGFSHGHVTCDAVMLDMYPRVVWHRYRGYPDIVLSSFFAARPIDEAGEVQDAIAVLQVMEEAITKWSDAAPFVKLREKQEEMVTDDAILLVLRDVRLLLATPDPTLAEIRERLEARLIDIRHTGPEEFPRSISRLIHSDLATKVEFEHALREPTVLKFTAKHEEFVRIVANEKVQMGSGGHAGMKTNRIMVPGS